MKYAEAQELCKKLNEAANNATARTERAHTATSGTADHCSMCGERDGCAHPKGWA